MIDVTYNDAQQSYNDFLEARSRMDDYTVSLSNDIAKVPALEAIDMIDSQPTMRDKAEFCKKLLLNSQVVVKCKDRVVAQFSVLPQTEWFSIHEFNEEPYALKFLVTAVYGRFLKRAAGNLHDSPVPPPSQDQQESTEVLKDSSDQNE